MKLALVLSFAAVTLFTACGTTFSVSRPFGDGKAYASLTNGETFELGYRGKLPVPKDGKAVVAF